MSTLGDYLIGTDVLGSPPEGVDEVEEGADEAPADEGDASADEGAFEGEGESADSGDEGAFYAPPDEDAQAAEDAAAEMEAEAAAREADFDGGGDDDFGGGGGGGGGGYGGGAGGGFAPTPPPASSPPPTPPPAASALLTSPVMSEEELTSVAEAAERAEADAAAELQLPPNARKTWQEKSKVAREVGNSALVAGQMANNSGKRSTASERAVAAGTKAMATGDKLAATSAATSSAVSKKGFDKIAEPGKEPEKKPGNDAKIAELTALTAEADRANAEAEAAIKSIPKQEIITGFEVVDKQINTNLIDAPRLAKVAAAAREAGLRAFKAGEQAAKSASPDVQAAAALAVEAGRKARTRADALEAAIKGFLGGVKTKGSDVPSEDEIQRAIDEADAAAGEAEGMVAFVAPAGSASPQKSFRDVMGASFDAGKVDRVTKRALAASQRVIDLGKRAIKGGNRKAGDRAVAAGNRAAASAKNLTDAVAKVKAQAKPSGKVQQQQAKPAAQQQAKPAQAQAKPIAAKPQVKKTAVKGDGPILKTALPGVATDEQWTQFAHALRAVDENGEPVLADAVSPSNELGMFALKPRRLADLDIVMNIERTKAPNGRMVWIADFVPPLTLEIFLAKPRVQYAALVRSIRDYVQKLRDKSIPAPDGGKPPDMTLSGALAILQKCGPSGLKTWNDVERRFESTAELYERTNGIF